MKYYTGEGLRKKTDSDPLKIDPYWPSKNVIDAVRLAQILKRPLLVKGEPGCGKSRLAEAVAAELFGSEFNNFYFTWNVKSTSKAQDGLYKINNLQRLSDANIRTAEGSAGTEKSDGDVKENDSSDDKKKLDIKLYQNDDGTYKSKGNYIELGELGRAFLLTYDKKTLYSPVVLIDEIDKADIDFPNDLLLELDKMEFPIPEIRDGKGDPLVIKANPERPDIKPLFIITSNDEKPLPAAFLRRCLFYYIDFKEIQLMDIVKARYSDWKDDIIKDAVGKFVEWRDKIDKMGTGGKNISTSELLDWIKIIDHYEKETPGTVSEALAKTGGPDYSPVLLKDTESIKVFTEKKDPEKK